MKQYKRTRTFALRRLAGVLLALLMVFSALPTLADVAPGSYVSPASASVNYYSYDGMSLYSLGLLSMGNNYLVSGTQEISGIAYYKITVNGTDCYVKAANMALSAAAADTTAASSYVTVGGGTTASASASTAASGQAAGTLKITPAGTTNMRSAAQMASGNIVATVKHGTVLSFYSTVVPPSGNHVWYYCYDPVSGQYGYIVDDCVEVLSVNEGATVAQLPNPSAAQTSPTADPAVANSKAVGYVRITPKGKTNIRKTTQSNVKNVAAQAEQDDVLPYYAVSVVNGATWYYVYYAPEAVFGYVQGNCAEIVNSAAPAPTPSSTAASFTNTPLGTLRFTAAGVNLRKTASTGAKVLGQFEKGEETAYYGTVINNNRTWYQVRKGDTIGYVLGDFCQVISGSGNAAPAPTATTPPKAVDYIMTIQDRVWIRKTPSTSAKAKGQALLGAVFHFTGTVTGGGARWYRIEYNGEICYIMAKFCRVLNDAEYAAYQNQNNANSQNNANNNSNTAELSSIAVTTMSKVILRAEGRSGGKQLALIYRAGTQAQLLGPVVESGNYKWYNVSVNGTTGWIRGDLLRILTKDEANALSNGSSGSGSGSGNGSSVNGVTLYKPELIDWNTGGIQTIFAKGDTAIVTDVKTGISFTVRRWAGGDHADVEPLTAADTAAMCRIYGVSKAQEINDKNLYQRHPVLVTLKGHSYASSMYGVPHNYPDGDTIPGNNFNGQFCLHFVNSRIHKTNKVDKDHQNAIMYAYENAARLLGIN